MRSWQRVSLLGAGVLVVGAVLQVGTHDLRSGFLHDAGTVSVVVVLGIGASMIASALVTRLVASHVFGLDVADAVEALRGASPLTRSDQTITIYLDVVGDQVLVVAEHPFALHAAAPFPHKERFHLYTDRVPWGSDAGFRFVLEPNGNVLKDEALAACVSLSDDRRKWQFRKEYRFSPREPSKFVIETFGCFRLSDRLIWTVEQISSDFTLRVVDRREPAGWLCVRVNHHRANDVVRSERPTNGWTMRCVEFRGEVLPYQGFELQWGEGEEPEAELASSAAAPPWLLRAPNGRRPRRGLRRSAVQVVGRLAYARRTNPTAPPDARRGR